MKFISWLSALACACCGALAVHYADIAQPHTAMGWASACLFAGVTWMFCATEPSE